jgi:FAD/FMN-containing dehydrogenase
LTRRFLPRGWAIPVSPGTQFVTLGGMVAADVHGKNHHVHGTIGRHLISAPRASGDGRIVECSPAEEPGLFWATVGGMGLTGHILDVTVRLVRVPSAWITGFFTAHLRHRRVRRRAQAIGRRVALHDGWIDCLARGRHMGEAC